MTSTRAGRRNIGLGESVRSLPKEKDRRAPELRERVLEATVALLSEQGYAGTTLHKVAERAGLSLGSVQHQFPSRAELMAAVMAMSIDANEADYIAVQKEAGSLDDLVRGAMRVGWRIVNKPLFVATMEITSGTRGDPALAAYAAEAIKARDRNRIAMIQAASASLGVDLPLSETFLALYRVITSGLAFEMSRGTPEGDAKAAYDIFEDFMASWVNAKLAELSTAPQTTSEALPK
jgi:AcrR family transcriptional regulator